MSEVNPMVKLVVELCGVGYFTAWSASFYPQIILNYRRKSTSGVSPDFLFINPLGFLALSLWNWGIYFVPTIRDQYRARHDGHEPQVAPSDLAFSLHAFILSVITLAQVFWYRRRNRNRNIKPRESSVTDERSHLLVEGDTQVESRDESSKESINVLAPDKPSVLCQLAIAGILLVSLGSAVPVWVGKTEALDWLYLMSSIKLFISIVKYVPQIILNYRLKSVKGFALSAIFCDLTGSILSFAQLVISSIYVEHDPSGIIANPAKLGLAAMSFAFDGTFIAQKWIYSGKKADPDTIEVDSE